MFPIPDISKYLLLTIDNWLDNAIPEKGAEARILALTKDGSKDYIFFFI